jgi:hypothetical protein
MTCPVCRGFRRLIADLRHSASGDLGTKRGSRAGLVPSRQLKTSGVISPTTEETVPDDHGHGAAGLGSAARSPGSGATVSSAQWTLRIHQLASRVLCGSGRLDRRTTPAATAVGGRSNTARGAS